MVAEMNPGQGPGGEFTLGIDWSGGQAEASRTVVSRSRGVLPQSRNSLYCFNLGRFSDVRPGSEPPPTGRRRSRPRGPREEHPMPLPHVRPMAEGPSEPLLHDLPPIRFDGQVVAVRLAVRRAED